MKLEVSILSIICKCVKLMIVCVLKTNSYVKVSFYVSVIIGFLRILNHDVLPTNFLQKSFLFVFSITTWKYFQYFVLLLSFLSHLSSFLFYYYFVMFSLTIICTHKMMIKNVLIGFFSLSLCINNFNLICLNSFVIEEPNPQGFYHQIVIFLDRGQKNCFNYTVQIPKQIFLVLFLYNCLEFL